ncbi:agmatine deiminase [Naumannella cuiyingiana]|uniref:Agmatine deiminase n=1 Tax=Naumannella cuiyingiana TaxID=1347891 RepID=A0A7Z0D998_9ACTN|nr:agmatine deiminase [Naumannella cuiyingiana]
MADDGYADADPRRMRAMGGEMAWTMPDEGEPHTRTWLALGATETIWGDDLIDEVWENLADLAGTIAEFEEVSVLVRPSDVAEARELLAPTVRIVEHEIDDLWVRDTGPVFVRGDGLAGVDFNFNGWGGKQDHAADATVAAAVIAQAGATALGTELVLEGGALEVDGKGTAIITRSCVLNDNRNPGWSQQDVEAELARLLGIRKVIWLPGVAGRDITDGHTDFYARFVRPGVVVAALDEDPQSFDHEVTREHLALLNEATDADGGPLEVVTLTAPWAIREDFLTDDFAAGYVNYYVCNGAVIMPEFGDRRADTAAATKLRQLFPEREIVPVAIDGIAAGGGGIHCATQQQPAP